MKVTGVSIDERTFALFLIALSIVVGATCPPLARLFEPIALPSLFLVVLFSLVPFARRAPRELIAINRDVLRVLLWQLLILPALVIAIGVIGRLPDHIISLLIVTACSGALFASPVLAALLELDQARALQCMVLSTLVMPVSLYVFLSLHSLQGSHMDLEVYILRIAIYLGIPALVFMGYRQVDRHLLSAQRANVEWVARWAVVVALAIFGIGMMKTVSERLVTNPGQVAFFLALTTILCIGMLTVTTIVMHRYGMGDALTAAILSGFRNVGLGYALIGEMLGPDLAVYVGVGLLPVFIAPLLMKVLATRRSAQRGAHAT